MSSANVITRQQSTAVADDHVPDDDGAGAGGGAAAAADGKQPQSQTASYAPLIRHTDMSEEMRSETIEIVVQAVEKHPANNENAARMIKEAMDKKFGASWHTVVGEGFGIEITHEVKNLLYMFFGCSIAVCVWKCS